MRIHHHHRHLRLRSGQNLGLVLVLSNLRSLGAQLGDLVIHQLHSGFDCRRRGFLQIGINCRVDPIALVVHLAFVEFADKGFAEQIDEVGRVTGFDVGRGQLQRRGLGLLGIGLA